MTQTNPTPTAAEQEQVLRKMSKPVVRELIRHFEHLATFHQDVEIGMYVKDIVPLLNSIGFTVTPAHAATGEAEMLQAQVRELREVLEKLTERFEGSCSVYVERLVRRAKSLLESQSPAVEAGKPVASEPTADASGEAEFEKWFNEKGCDEFLTADKPYLALCWQASRAHAQQQIDALAAKDAEEERQTLQLIDDRDEAEESLSQAYYLVTGNSPEWSNLFGHKEALSDIADVVELLKKSAKATPDEFKAYVHKRLDEMGITTHPDGPHGKEGCRVGDRLDIVLGAYAQLAEAKKLAMEWELCWAKTRGIRTTHPIPAAMSINVWERDNPELSDELDRLKLLRGELENQVMKLLSAPSPSNDAKGGEVKS